MQKKLTERSLTYIEQGQFDKARMIITDVIKRYPNDAEAYHILGVIEMRDANMAKAIELVLISISLDPSSATFYNTLANLHVSQNEYPKAEAAFSEAINYAPDEIEFRLNLANFYLSLNKDTEAVEHYEHALMLQHDNYTALRGMTMAFFYAGEIVNALKSATQWQEYYFEDEEPYYYKGLCLHSLGNISLALQEYDMGLALNTENDNLLTAVGVAFKDLGNYRLAKMNFMAALRLADNNANAIYHLGLIALEHDDLIKAREYFNNAISADEEFAEPVLGLGLVESRYGNDEKALRYYSLAGQIDIHFLEAKTAIASTLLKLQQFSDGWQYYDYRLSHTIAKNQLFDALPEIEAIPIWQGEALKEHDVLLVWLDTAAIEETIFASIYTDLMRKACDACEIIIQASPKLAQLIGRSFPSCTIISDLTYESIENAKVTYTIANGALAKLFRSSISQFSWDEHFLVADVSKKHNFTQKYQEIAKDKIKIGIIWQNKHERISMEQLKPLLTNNEYFFISLQAGPTNLHPNIYIEDTLNTAIDMDGLAACVASLDYVIGVDSQAIHLASSIGTPSFVITSFASNWYWFTQRCTSPWYTATTIVRQDDKINYINSLAQIHKIIQANKPQS